MLEHLFSGMLFVFQPVNFSYMLFGVIMGIIIGALPGMTGSMGIILLLPLVYRLPSDTAMVMICGLYCSSMYGGSVSAILLRTPGTPSAAATVLDGYPLGQKGFAGKAIGMAATASFFGGLLSTLCLILIAPELSKVALEFHAADYFSLSIFGLTIMASASGKNMHKGLMSGVIGLLVSTVGIDPILGMERFTFGNLNLMNGFPMLPVLIGVFAVSEVLFQATVDKKDVVVVEQDIKNIVPSVSEMRSCFMAALVGGVIGVLIGIVPGTGGAISCFLAYNVVQKLSKHPEKFGTGCLEGIAAPESSNNATTGGALIPMLTLGIPGDVVTSVMLGALVLIGIKPGPMLFVENVSIIYAIFSGMIVIQFLMLFLGLGFAKVAPHVLKVPHGIIMPMVLVFCVVGAFSLANQLYHVNIALIFGVIGLFMKKYGYPGAPLVLGIILGPMAEENLNRAITLSRGDWSILFTRPISAAFLVISALSISFAMYSAYRASKKAKSEKS